MYLLITGNTNSFKINKKPRQLKKQEMISLLKSYLGLHDIRIRSQLLTVVKQTVNNYLFNNQMTVVKEPHLQSSIVT